MRMSDDLCQVCRDVIATKRKACELMVISSIISTFAIKLIINMDQVSFEKRKPSASEKKPSMLRRCIGHDYTQRQIYMITIVTAGRRSNLGSLVGNVGTTSAPKVVLSPIGHLVSDEWWAIPTHHPEISVLALQIMPDHLHGILFVKEKMEKPLGMIIRGFKQMCNKHCRALLSDAVDGNLGLFERGFNDKILRGAYQLDRWIFYLHDNPYRLAMRREYPDLFKVRFGVTVGQQTFAAIGNRFLLEFPWKERVQLSRSIDESQCKAQVEKYMAMARNGAVLVSPAISKGEQEVMHAALEAGFPLIFLSPWGFNSFSRPGHKYYNACAAGHFLILAPWEHHNERINLTREMCLALNDMASEVVALATRHT